MPLGKCEKSRGFPDLIARRETVLLENLDKADKVDKAELLPVHEAAQWDWGREALLPNAPADHYRVTRLDRLGLPPTLLADRRADTVNRGVGWSVEATSPYAPDLDAPAQTRR